MEKFDLVVLGGGPGGYVAAIRASQLGLKTAIIEKDRLGGICLNWGCIPTKTLLKNAEVLHLIKNSRKYGIEIPRYTVHFDQTIKRSRNTADRLSKGVEFLMKKNNITHIVGMGKIKSGTDLIVEKDNQKQLIQADKIILATGGRPRTFSGMELDGMQVISAKEAMILETPPKKMIIIGGGAIGVEFAWFYNEFGTDVHVIEMTPHILPLEDEEISKELEKSFLKSGIKIHINTRVIKIEKQNATVKIHTETEGKKEIYEGDVALLAVGITGNVENIGLEQVGVIAEKGFITINEFNQTNIPNIYAIGDVTGPPWLAHVASAQGHVAAEHAADHSTNPVDYTNIPACTYCQPQVASLGLTEQQARDRGHEIKIGKFHFRASGKAMATGEITGLVKIIFDAEYGELLGAHIIGPEATELIGELGVAKALETTWQEIATTVHAHPTLSEAIMEAALDAFDRAIHK